MRSHSTIIFLADSNKTGMFIRVSAQRYKSACKWSFKTGPDVDISSANFPVCLVQISLIISVSYFTPFKI